MEIIKHLYKNTILGYIIIHPLKVIYDFYRFRLIPEKIYIKKEYRRIFGAYPDLENPKTLNEKIQWLKLYDRTPLHTICTDKYQSREYIKEKVGEQYLVPLAFETKNVKDINQYNLPDYPIVIKTNHSGGVEIIRNKAKIDYKELQRRLKKRLKENYYYQSKEWPYKNIEPRIVVEKLLVCQNGKIPYDYKFHCFNGKPKIVYVTVDREGKNRRNIYSINWEPLMFTWVYIGKDITSLRGEEISKPENYEQMVKIAEKLAKAFKYVRIDLYNVDGEIYCGEITFYHGSGIFPIIPQEWDKKLGDMLILEEKGY
jgi:hypothetical protein